MFRKLVTIVLPAIFLTGFYASVLHAKHPRGGFGPNPKQMHKMMEKLDLTEEQTTKLQELKKTHRATSKKSRAASKSSHEALHAALADATKSDEDLRKLHEAVVEASAANMTAKFDQMLEMRALLTDEQKKKMSEMLEKMPKKRKRGQRK